MSSALSTVTGSWTNSIKQKTLLALTIVLERLKGKAKQFKDMERIVKFQGKCLTEAAPEVWEEARNGLLKLWEILDTWDLDILMKWSMSDKEYEAVTLFYSKQGGVGTEWLMITNARSKGNLSEIQAKKKLILKSTPEETWANSPSWFNN